MEGMFLRRGAERAKLSQPRSGFWGHKRILNLVGHGGFTIPLSGNGILHQKWRKGGASHQLPPRGAG